MIHLEPVLGGLELIFKFTNQSVYLGQQCTKKENLIYPGVQTEGILKMAIKLEVTNTNSKYLKSSSNQSSFLNRHQKNEYKIENSSNLIITLNG